MSAIKLSTPSSGSISLSPANTASNLTITVPAISGTMSTIGPAFSAKKPSPDQSISNNTRTVIQASSEDFDTASCYDTSNYRFTPNVAGYYQVNWLIGLNASSMTYCDSALLKNGTVYRYGVLYSGSGINSIYSSGSLVIYMNGTTDYIQATGYITASSGQVLTADSYWSAVLVRTE